MAAEQLKILIVAHTFPPAPGIGGRRWAKHAKYLRRSGADVNVLTAKTDESGSLWTSDVEGIKRYTYRHQFPKVLGSVPKDIGEKLAYRAALTVNRLRSRGTPYDRALYDKASFIESLRALLHEKMPDVLVVTGAPFRLPWYALKLRQEFPNVKFVVDFRDPWTSSAFYGYTLLHGRRKEFEASAEAAVITGYDLVTTPWPTLAEELRQKYPDRAAQIHCLPHCYDPDDMAALKQNSLRNDPPRIVYGGNLYQGLDYIYQDLAEAALRKEVQVDMWASTHLPNSRAWLSDNFRMHEPVSSKTFFAEAASADALLFPIPEELRNGHPTKLLEYAATGLPLLAAGHPGSLSQLLVEKGLGTFQALHTGALNWQQMLTSASEMKADPEWISSHEAANATKRLIELIENIVHEP